MESRARADKPADRGQLPELPGELRRRSGRDDVVRTGCTAVVMAIRSEGIHDRAGGIREDNAEGMFPSIHQLAGIIQTSAGNIEEDQPLAIASPETGRDLRQIPGRIAGIMGMECLQRRKGICNFHASDWRSRGNIRRKNCGCQPADQPDHHQCQESNKKPAGTIPSRPFVRLNNWRAGIHRARFSMCRRAARARRDFRILRRPEGYRQDHRGDERHPGWNEEN